MNAANAPITVHPAAEAYRLMTEEELAGLAADIAANGQHDPIILGRVEGSTEQHTIVDGRNRAKACGIAGVVPTFETRNFKDEAAIRAFVKSRSERRDISKGQRAMGHALLFPDPEKGKKGVQKLDNFSKQRLSQARAILGHSRALALAVRDGSEKFDEALKKVSDERKQLETTEAKLVRLHKDSPDLAEIVVEERMSVDDAIAALDKREQVQAAELKNKREVQMRLAEALFRGALAFSVAAFAEELRDDLVADAEYSKEFFERLRIEPANLADVVAGAAYFCAVLTHGKDSE
jgi:ParB-like chromosome segregation protein Spo0J